MKENKRQQNKKNLFIQLYFHNMSIGVDCLCRIDNRWPYLLAMQLNPKIMYDKKTYTPKFNTTPTIYNRMYIIYVCATFYSFLLYVHLYRKTQSHRLLFLLLPFSLLMFTLQEKKTHIGNVQKKQQQQQEKKPSANCLPLARKFNKTPNIKHKRRCIWYGKHSVCAI